MGVEKLAAKTKKLNPDQSLPPSIELTVRYLLAKAETIPRVRVGNESAQAPQPKPAQAYSSTAVAPPLPPSTVEYLSSSATPTTARPTTLSSALELSVLGDDEDDDDDETSFHPSSVTKTTGGASNVKEEDEVDIEDFDDDNFDDYAPTNRTTIGAIVARSSAARFSRANPDDAPLSNTVSPPHKESHRASRSGSVKLSTADAAAIKELLFAKQGGRQPASWIQGFFFSQQHGLEYGLVQREGGPCGVLAAVQAHLLKQLVGKTGGHPTRITREQQRNALCKGLSSAIWQARGNEASVCVIHYVSSTGGAGTSTVGICFDELLRSARTDRAESVEHVERLVEDSLRQWEEPRGQGLCMFLLSLLMSRGVAETRGDMDEAGSSLIGAYG